MFSLWAIAAYLSLFSASIFAEDSKNMLLENLQSVRFLHEGVSRSDDEYMFHPINCMYLEGENISCAQCSWGANCAYKFQGFPGPLPYTPLPPKPGYDRPGGDLRTVVQSQDSWQTCQSSCCGDGNCVGWVYVPSAPTEFMTCRHGDHCCYLKSTSVDPQPSSLSGITTGAVDRPSVDMHDPPLGIRSSVPLGGIGAGALELRGDGTFHEVYIYIYIYACACVWGTDSCQLQYEKIIKIL